MDHRNPAVTTAHRRVLEQGDPALVQLWFDPAVLDRYRISTAYQVIRTDTIGRVSRPRIWSLDFGIGEGEAVIHLSLRDLLDYLPEAERDHWAQYVVTLPLSVNYVQTRLAPGSCIDDGDVRKW